MRALFVLAVVPLAGCPQNGMVADGTSVSWGKTNNGKLMNPQQLPAQGTGYWIPPRWHARGIAYGTDELVDLIIYLGRRLAEQDATIRLGVADLSPRRGGPSFWHRSHQAGRDVDLLYFARDSAGKPVHLDRMARFGANGMSKPEKAPDGTMHPTVKFDDARNWKLVRALLENPIAEVQYIFVFRGLRQRLLDFAQRHGEPADVIAKASYILRQPGDSAIHDDHMHVRIYCASTDRNLGACYDRGRLRWTKKWRKYGGGSPRVAMVRDLEQKSIERLRAQGMPAMLVLTGLLPR